jgi:hypothetical protein
MPQLSISLTRLGGVPLKLEQFIIHGVLLCADSLLYLFSYLPLRILLMPLHLVRGRANRSHVFDFVNIALIAVGCISLSFLRFSVWYHMLRGQAVLQIYVIFNMLEIVDKLFTSVGQDIMSSLYRNIRNEPTAVSCLFYFAMAAGYVVLHSFVKYLQLLTLNIGINSDYESRKLLTLLLSNNFLELKDAVFRRFTDSELFQIGCTDVCER